MPTGKEITTKYVDLKRRGAMLYVAQEQAPKDSEQVLLLKGMKPRTLQSLALVSEVIHGTPSRFSDQTRFSFAHGGKGRRPYAVPTKIYNQTIHMLKTSVQRAKLGQTDKQQACSNFSKWRRLPSRTSLRMPMGKPAWTRFFRRSIGSLGNMAGGAFTSPHNHNLLPNQ